MILSGLGRLYVREFREFRELSEIPKSSKLFNLPNLPNFSNFSNLSNLSNLSCLPHFFFVSIDPFVPFFYCPCVISKKSFTFV